MAAGQANRIVHHLRWLAHGCEERARTDGQLLDSFIGRQDESAFEELVRRHGPMVLGVCRRVLGHAQDAEDAFQATFMVLVRKARSVLPRDLVGNWLYGVACRVALDAQSRASRRRAREKQVEDMPHPSTPPADLDHDLRPLLDRELKRLPDKYRSAIVLCDLEGRTRKDVARQLGVPEGTLSSRLNVGRKLLAARLVRRGLPLTAVTLTAALGGMAHAAVPGALAISTIKAAVLGAAGQAVAVGLLSAHAASLTEGVIKAMFISKLKSLAAVVLTVGLLASSAGVMKLTADEPKPGQASGPAGQAAPAKKTIVVEGEGPSHAGHGRGVVIGDFDEDGFPDIFVQAQATIGKRPKVIILEVDDDAQPKQAAKDADALRLLAEALKKQLGDKGAKDAEKTHAWLLEALQKQLQGKPGPTPPATDDWQQLLGEYLRKQIQAQVRPKPSDAKPSEAKPQESKTHEWAELLAEIHRNPKYAHKCVQCHQANKPADAWSERTFKFEFKDLKDLSQFKQFRDFKEFKEFKQHRDSKPKEAQGEKPRESEDVIVIRISKKGGASGDIQFLRRLCLDAIGRHPTPLEQYYFLKDSDPNKHRIVVEKLLATGEKGEVTAKVIVRDKAATSATSRAEEYVKDKLGKKQLTPEERQLVQKVLEFMERERPAAGPGERFWQEWGAPKVAPKPPAK
jgi:RNA polymerase sigma factor (sigma-70 family)